METDSLCTRPLLVYVPTYNCESTIAKVLEDIPASVQGIADILVIDNCSTDGTVKEVLRLSRKSNSSHRIHLIQPPRNLGYAGSQKLAYAIACASPGVAWVAMLHGDGQYPSALLGIFEQHLGSDAGVIYGYRSKRHYPSKEETPLLTWSLIRLLSACESVVTGVHRREWHSGFVMHATRFLRKVDLSSLTDTPHIDGNLLFAAKVVGETAQAVPIYKLYKQLNAFEGAARRRYVVDVFRLMVSFRIRHNNIARGDRPILSPEELAGGEIRIII